MSDTSQNFTHRPGDCFRPRLQAFHLRYPQMVQPFQGNPHQMMWLDPKIGYAQK